MARGGDDSLKGGTGEPYTVQPKQQLQEISIER
jgi:hypothetical protein